MPTVLGMQTTVGEKPKPLTQSCIKVFNEIFGQLMALKTLEFETNYYESYDEPFDKTSPRGAVLEHGYFTLSRVVRWLAYYQLVAVAKRKEPKEDKNVTVWTVNPTKIGKQAFKRGEIVALDVGWRGTVEMGLGPMYAVSFNSLWNMVSGLAEAGRIAKTRREKWYGAFVNFWMEHLMAVKKTEVEEQVRAWAVQKIAGAPKMRRRKANIKSGFQKHLNHQITSWCKH